MKRILTLMTACGLFALVSCQPEDNAVVEKDFNYTASLETARVGETVTFTDNSINVESRTWTFEDGTPATSSEATVDVVFNSTGTKEVTLTVTYSDGTEDHGTLSIEVTNPLSADIAVAGLTEMGCAKSGAEITFSLYYEEVAPEATGALYITDTIAADGTTEFPFDHASDYAIIIDLHSRAPMTLSFTDVPEGSYYEDAVIWAVEKGVTGGTSPTTFTPDGICTRAQAVTFLWRAAGSPAPRSTAMDFADVPAGSYYYDAVLWAVENGITNGTSDTAFGPGQNCSRAQIVTFLYRAAGSPAVSGSPAFSDVASDAYYAKAVKWAQANGITSGIGGGLFGSNDNCTRAQIVTFIWRSAEK